MEKFDKLNCQLWKSLAYFAIKDPKMPLEHWPQNRALPYARWQWWSYLIVHDSDPKSHLEDERALVTFDEKQWVSFSDTCLRKKGFQGYKRPLGPETTKARHPQLTAPKDTGNKRLKGRCVFFTLSWFMLLPELGWPKETPGGRSNRGGTPAEGGSPRALDKPGGGKPPGNWKAKINKTAENKDK